jgi:cytochrome b6-f complex iron-sulfur subunit
LQKQNTNNNLKIGVKDNTNQRRVFIKYLPFILAGTLSYPTGKFIFFSENKNQEFTVALKTIKEGITEIKKHSVFIYKNGKKIEVLNAHCTHMGCILNFYKNKNKFICPCHHSEFSINGKRIKGPAKRNLDKVAFKIKNKTLYIG